MNTTRGAKTIACFRIIENDKDLESPDETQIQYEMDRIVSEGKRQSVDPTVAAIIFLAAITADYARNLAVVMEGEEDEEEEAISQGDSHSA